MPVCTRYWKPYRRAVEYAERLADECPGLIVELGPGARPFSRATEFVGRFENQFGVEYNGKWHQCDLSRERLPYLNDSVDFLYARHVIEDLDDPAWCLSEIARVAKAGYIETPSPIAEMCRGVDVSHGDGRTPEWRGYHHHRSFVWDSNGTLSVIAKWPIVEHVPTGDGDEYWAGLLNEGPLYWNTYFAWTGELKWHYYQHELDYEIGKNYGSVLDVAITECMESAGRLP